MRDFHARIRTTTSQCASQNMYIRQQGFRHLRRGRSKRNSKKAWACTESKHWRLCLHALFGLCVHLHPFALQSRLVRMCIGARGLYQACAPRNRTSPVWGKMGRGRWHGRLWRFWLRSRVAGRSDGKRQSYLSSGHQQMGPRHHKYQKSLCACLGFGYMMPSLSVWRMPQTHDTAPTCSTMLCLPSQARSAIHLVATVANTKRRGLHSLLGPGRLNTCTESAGLPLQHLEECRD